MRWSRSLFVVSAGAAAVAAYLATSVAQVPRGSDVVPITVASPSPAVHRVAALGRIEPKDGVRRIAGPSNSSVVVLGRLLVDQGEPVEEGQTIAVLDTFDVLTAEIAVLRSKLKRVEDEYRRHKSLHEQKVVSDSDLTDWATQREALTAELDRAQAELARAVVRSPIRGQVVAVHARAGERVGPDGIVEVGRTDAMYAIAEVFETDVDRVRVGQRATIRSPAFADTLGGTVDRIGMRIGKRDVLDDDPAARTNARVVEVEIRLDDSARVARFTNLQVDVVIELGSSSAPKSSG